jgi:outer membrane immunogenic protein
MNKLALAIASLSALVAAPAFAADLTPAPVYKAPPPVVVPPPQWTGWYIGVNIGGSFGTATQTATFPATILPTSPFGSASSDLDGVIGGAQIGYNWQTGNWVLGIEADIQATSEQASSSLTGTGSVSIPGALLLTSTGILNITEKLDWFGTVRGRLGVLGGPNWLFYGTGGLAYGGVDTDTTLTVGALSAVNNFNTTRTGWTAGAGIEGWFGQNWTAKLEYLYLDLGSFSNTFTGLGVFSPVVLNTHLTDNIVRVGVDYHFNWAAPIATRY